MGAQFHTVIDVFLAVYFLIIGLHYTATTLGLKHRDGQTRIHYGAKGSRTWTIRWVFNSFRLAILSLVVLRLFVPAIDTWVLGRLVFEGELIVRTVGMMAMLGSLFMISYIHAYMAAQWQSGICDADAQQFLLIKTGPYRRCRHPLFSAIMLGMLGLALALPSVFTLITLVAGVTALVKQAGEEERRLSVHGNYQQYLDQTPAWPISRGFL